MTILLYLMGEQRLLVDIYIIEWELHVKIIEACRGSTIMHVFVNRCGMKMSPLLINLTIYMYVTATVGFIVKS